MPKSVKCIIRKCRRRSDRDKEVKYFAIPAERLTGPLYSRLRSVRRRLLWVARINSQDFTIDNIKRYMRVCGHHFVSGAPCKASDESNPDWAPSLHLGYDLPSTQHSKNTAPIGSESGGDVTMIEHPSSSESSNIISARPGVMVKEEVLGDEDDSDEPELKLKTSVIHQEVKMETPTINFETKTSAIDFVRVSMIDLPDGTASGVSFVNKEAELLELHKLHSDLQDDHTLLQKEQAELQKEHAEFKKSYIKLRDKLTDAEVDKLELKDELAKLTENCDRRIKENAVLQAVSAAQLEKVESYKKEILELQNQLQEAEIRQAELSQKMDKAFSCGFTSELLKRDDLLVECYTGLPSYSVIEGILSRVTFEITEISHLLVPWECLLLTLMRLKLSLKLQILGERFGVSVSTAHKIFERWLYYLYKGLRIFIKWPENRIFLKSTPTFFKKVFDDCTVFIVDVMEVFAGRAGKQDGDYSNNKSAKFLLAFTPDGKVAFVSKEWDGKCSDTYVTANSGLLEKLSVGDVILAKHGFPVGENDGFYCAKVIQPKSPSGKIQLDPLIISQKDKPSSFQRYVKNITNVVTNKFSILQSAVPWEMFAMKHGHDVNQIEEVISVCCALSNLSHN